MNWIATVLQATDGAGCAVSAPRTSATVSERARTTVNTKRLAATLLTTAALVGGSVSAATTSGPGTGTGSGTGGGVHVDLPVVTGATKITFPAGSTRATVNAKIGPQDRAAHTFSATKGQRARIQLDGSSTGAFTLTAPDGSRQLTLTIRR